MVFQCCVLCTLVRPACRRSSGEPVASDKNIRTTRTNPLTAFYPRWPGSAGTRRNIHSLTPCLFGYYTTSLINSLHFLQSMASFLHICRVWQSFSMTSLLVFLGLPLGLTHSISKSMHVFTQPFSPFLKKCSYQCNYITYSSSLSQLTIREPLCYFNATHPPSHSHFSLLVLILHWPHSLPCSIPLPTF